MIWSFLFGIVFGALGAGVPVTTWFVFLCFVFGLAIGAPEHAPSAHPLAQRGRAA